MQWSRTVRLNAVLDDAARAAIGERLSPLGASARFMSSPSIGRTYALIEGSQALEPAEVEPLISGRWFTEAIIALAIEPAPQDALPLLQTALGGRGAPAGVLSCEAIGGRAIVELAPSVTPFSFIMQLVDVELRRFAGHRHAELLSPLPVAVVASVAADGLQAPELAPDRILEMLLQVKHVE